MISNKILYVFGSGRKDRIKIQDFSSTEFFYGYFYFKDKYENIDLIEMKKEELPVQISHKFLLVVDKILRKLSNLPFFFNLINTTSNFKKIYNSNIVIATNDRLGLSIWPMVLISKIIKKIEVYVVVMGLFSKPKQNIITKYFQRFFLTLFIKTSKKLIFLGKGEYKNAESDFPRFKEKFLFIPFCVDNKFWSKEKIGENNTQRDSILFIGNDGNRDYEKVIEIANSLSELNFNLITNYSFEEKLIPKNVSLIKGSWNENLLTDEEIREYYANALVTILPLHDTYQPSGQSVTLQSMALGTPVIITETEGFWDINNFENKENIVFVENNDIKNWINEIKNLIVNEKLRNNISKNSIDTIEKFYKQEYFNKTLEETIGLVIKNI